MLPKIIYESLPYAYIGTGVTSGFVSDSKMMFVFTMILATVGVIILFMRMSYRKSAHSGMNDKVLLQGILAEKRSKQQVEAEIYAVRSSSDRRISPVTIGEFPIIDNDGKLVKLNRRTRHDRRILQAA